MKSLLGAVVIGLFAGSAQAQTLFDPNFPLVILNAADTDLSEFVWKKRPIIVFANSENDPAFIEQIELLIARPEALTERDVVVIVDTDPETLSPIRRRMRPRGFMLTLVGKDGDLKLRKPFPQDVREITASIDKMPIRKLEVREAKERAVK